MAMSYISLPLRALRSASRSIVVSRAYSAESASSQRQLDDGERNIFKKLTENFSPTELQVQDVSGGCGTFYAIHITSDSFKGLPMIKQHRLVNDTLKKEIEGIHGLQLKTSTPE